MYSWYDSWWLTEYARARAILEREAPGKIEPFTAALKVFEAPGFDVVTLPRVFDEETMREIERTLSSIPFTELEMHEAETFGRFIKHDLPYFTELQRSIVPLVSELAGEPVEPSYNFASMYGAPGHCPAHLDSPEAKYTLDLCVRQSAPWPIHFSQTVAWPEPGASVPGLAFTAVTLEPGQAALFSGCNQWHYRDKMPPHAGRQFCDLLFFHFIPAGTAELVSPANWARIFGVPGLEGLRASKPSL